LTLTCENVNRNTISADQQRARSHTQPHTHSARARSLSLSLTHKYTHVAGHNIPDAKGDRYCIDLVCISGYPQFGVTQEPQIVSAKKVFFYLKMNIEHIYIYIYIYNIIDLALSV
jgi:hypothetical protein